MKYSTVNNRLQAFFLAVAVLLSYILLIWSIVIPTGAQDFDNINTDNVSAVYLYNIENSTVLVEKNISKRIAPVSTAKLMAGLVACELLADKLDQKITVTANMVEDIVGFHYGLKSGSTATVRDLLYMAFCVGYQDAINILCFTTCGSISGFVEKMNRKAQELGMSSTYYTNPSGLTDPLMYTTVEDIVKLSFAAKENSLLMQIASSPDYVTEGMVINDDFYNRNRLISTQYSDYHNSLCRGLCAGYTNPDGASVVTISDNGEISYLCIVMGATGIAAGAKIADEPLCYNVANALLDTAYSSYGYVDVLSADEVICQLPVLMSIDTESVLVVPQSSLRAYLPLSKVIGVDITYSTKLTSESLDAPVKEGEVVGFITVYDGDCQIGTVPLVTKTSVNQSDVLVILNEIKEFTQSRFFIASVISAVIITILYIVGRAIYRGTVSKSHTRYRR